MQKLKFYIALVYKRNSFYIGYCLISTRLPLEVNLDAYLLSGSVKMIQELNSKIEVWVLFTKNRIKYNTFLK
jgi:hypothetical protein